MRERRRDALKTHQDRDFLTTAERDKDGGRPTSNFSNLVRVFIPLEASADSRYTEPNLSENLIQTHFSSSCGGFLRLKRITVAVQREAAEDGFLVCTNVNKRTYQGGARWLSLKTQTFYYVKTEGRLSGFPLNH